MIPSITKRRGVWAFACTCLITAATVGGYFLLIATPGCQSTVAEPLPAPAPYVPAVETLAELRADWDADAAFNWAATPTLATFCRDAYLDPEPAAEAYRAAGFETCHAINHGSHWAFILTQGDLCVVVFRGTDDMADWRTNIDSAPLNTPDGAVHGGFWVAYGHVSNEIAEQVAERKPRFVWTTGHSLGGALAVMCAWDLIDERGIDVHGVMTFGQPMVAMRQLARHFDDILSHRYAHIVNQTDIVARIPPGYSHCGSLVWFKGDAIRRSVPRVFGANGPGAEVADDVELPPLSPEEYEVFKANVLTTEPEVIRTPEGERIYRGDTPFLRDHGMEHYLTAIKKAIGKN